jgi:hypothetical protein
VVYVPKRVYGREHRALRAQWAPHVDAGGVACARCGKRIKPGTPWDLGHSDDWSRYTGPEHERCNAAAAGRKRIRLERARRQSVPASRSW